MLSVKSAPYEMTVWQEEHCLSFMPPLPLTWGSRENGLHFSEEFLNKSNVDAR